MPKKKRAVKKKGAKGKRAAKAGGMSKTVSSEAVKGAVSALAKEVFLIQIADLELRMKRAQAKYNEAMQRYTVRIKGAARSRAGSGFRSSAASKPH